METLKRQLIVNALLACEFDDLSHNVDHNRILKTTLAELAVSADVDRGLRADLADLCRRLSAIEKINLSTELFHRLSFHRNNSFYGFLMDVCEMVWRYYLVTEEPGKEKFRNLIRDENKMARVFEDFVKNFFKIELEDRYPGYAVRGAEEIRWDVSGAEEADMMFLPRMMTDISMNTPEGYLIIDVKYYKNTLQSHYDEKIHSRQSLSNFFIFKKCRGKGTGI